MADPQDLINALIGPRPADPEKTWKTYDPFGTEYDAQQIPPPAVDPLDLLAMRFGLGRGGLANSAMAKGPWTKEAAPVGRPTQQQAFQNLDRMDTDLAHLGAAKNALGKSGVSDAMAAMTARQRQGFMESLSPMEKLQYYYSWTPKGLPESPLFSPGFWAAVTGLAGPQAYFLYDNLRSNAEERQRRPLPVLPDAPY